MSGKPIHVVFKNRDYTVRSSRSQNGCIKFEPIGSKTNQKVQPMTFSLNAILATTWDKPTLRMNLRFSKFSDVRGKREDHEMTLEFTVKDNTSGIDARVKALQTWIEENQRRKEAKPTDREINWRFYELQKNPETQRLHEQLVSGSASSGLPKGILSEEEFWSYRQLEHSDDRRLRRTQKRGLSTAFLSDMRPQLTLKRAKYSITDETQQLIFAEYPQLRLEHKNALYRKRKLKRSTAEEEAKLSESHGGPKFNSLRVQNEIERKSELSEEEKKECSKEWWVSYFKTQHCKLYGKEDNKGHKLISSCSKDTSLDLRTICALADVTSTVNETPHFLQRRKLITLDNNVLGNRELRLQREEEQVIRKVNHHSAVVCKETSLTNEENTARQLVSHADIARSQAIRTRDKLRQSNERFVYMYNTFRADQKVIFDELSREKEKYTELKTKLSTSDHIHIQKNLNYSTQRIGVLDRECTKIETKLESLKKKVYSNKRDAFQLSDDIKKKTQRLNEYQNGLLLTSLREARKRSNKRLYKLATMEISLNELCSKRKQNEIELKINQKHIMVQSLEMARKIGSSVAGPFPQTLHSLNGTLKKQNSRPQNEVSESVDKEKVKITFPFRNMKPDAMRATMKPHGGPSLQVATDFGKANGHFNGRWISQRKTPVTSQESLSGDDSGSAQQYEKNLLKRLKAASIMLQEVMRHLLGHGGVGHKVNLKRVRSSLDSVGGVPLYHRIEPVLKFLQAAQQKERNNIPVKYRKTLGLLLKPLDLQISAALELLAKAKIEVDDFLKNTHNSASHKNGDK